MSLDRGVRILRPAEIVGAEAWAIRAGVEVFSLPAGIASKAAFFDAACVVFPLNPPLARVEDNWDALGDSLSGGLLDLDGRSVVIVWRDPWVLADADHEAGRIATEILSALPDELADPKISAGHTKAVTTILGTRGV